MATEPQLTKKDLSVPDMGITFNEIHSDEPHETLDGKKTEVKEPYVPGLGTHVGNRENVFDVGKAYEDEHNEVGMIVSDKKRSRGFSEGIAAAFQEWWGGTKKKFNTPIITTKQPPQLQSVQKAETRAEVIKSAISPHAVAPKDDHHIIIEKIRTFKQDVARATGAPVIVKDTEKKTAGWTHTMEDTPALVTKKEPPVQSIPPSDLRSTNIAPIVKERSEIKIGEILEERPSVPPVTTPTLSAQVNEELTQITVPETVAKDEIVVPTKTIAAAPEITSGSISVEKKAEPKREEAIVPPVPPRPKISSFFQKKPKARQEDSHVSISAIPMTMPTSVPERARIPVVLPKAPQPKVPVAPIEKPSVVAVVPAPTVTQPKQETVTEKPPVQQVPPKPATIPPMPRVSPPLQRIEVAPVSQNVPREEPRKESLSIPKPQVPEPVKQSIKAVELPKPLRGDTATNTSTPATSPEFHAPEKSVPGIFKLPSTPTKLTEKKITQEVTKQKTSSTTSLTRWVLLGVVALIGVALAIFASIYVTQKTEVEPTVNTEVHETIAPVIPKLFAVDAQVPIPLGSDRGAFISSIQKEVTSASQEILQFYPTVQSGATTYPASTAEILAVLEVSLNAKTQRALENTLMMGSVKTTTNEPYIIIQSYNFDALFAGMLAWEEDLYTNFAPLFGSATIEPSPFSDKIVRNKSVRILHNSNGTKEILLYSFINQNTVVITSSTEALIRIIDTFKPESAKAPR